MKYADYNISDTRFLMYPDEIVDQAVFIQITYRDRFYPEFYSSKRCSIPTALKRKIAVVPLVPHRCALKSANRKQLYISAVFGFSCGT